MDADSVEEFKKHAQDVQDILCILYIPVWF